MQLQPVAAICMQHIVVVVVATAQQFVGNTLKAAVAVAVAVAVTFN